MELANGENSAKMQKDVFSGDELNYLLQIKGLVIFDHQNELGFACKNGQTNS